MAAQLPDTPGDSPGRNGAWPRERSTFSIDGPDDKDGSPHSQQGFDRPDQTVFDLTMDYSDDETLLDWEQYAGMRKFKCWGMDCSLIARFCPFMPCVPQEWYYRYSQRQRKLMAIGFSTCIALLLLLVGATVLLTLLPKQNSPTGLGYSSEECEWSSYHLPTGVKPVQYDLEMTVELEPPYLVAGQMTVYANVTRPSKCIVMHALDMNISHINRLNPDTPGSWRVNDQEQLILEFDEPIIDPNVSFVVQFNYTLKQGLSGFYRSNYTTADGQSHVMATTQMEANSARKAFPCFDEPAMKAIWNFTMTAPADQTVLFNMNQLSSIPIVAVGSSMATRTFMPTPPMSSYLVAIIVGDLTAVSRNVAGPNGVGPERPVSIWSTPERAGSLSVALEIATRILPEYERLFGVAYPLPKLDLVAIPDFAAGAMENWGLITYRETDLLYTASSSSLQNERRIALVIAHEMAHLWFGDLVTMKDWGELWLNEGFATYFENVGASIVRPDFAYYETFYSDLATSALEEDSYPKSTHPLATLSGMDTAEKVEGMFDSISYDKGGSVLRMLRAYLNRLTSPMPLLRRALLQDSPAPLEREVFLQGLQNYLLQHSFNNTSSNDLWAALDAATGEDITGWMRSWTFQPGFPRVQILSDGPANREMKVYQAPFQFSGPKACNPKGSLKEGTAPWWIPLAFFSASDPATSWRPMSTCDMLNEPIYTLKDDNDWFKLNAGQYGLFRVNYPKALWERLAMAASAMNTADQPPLIPAVDLAGLLDDSWALAQADETPVEHFLNLLKALGSRRAAEYAAWSVSRPHITDVYRYLQLRPIQDCATKWATFVTNRVIGPTLSSHSELALNASEPAQGRAVPDVQMRLLRPLLASLSTEFNDSGARMQARLMFQDRLKISVQNASVAGIEADIRGNVYAFIASSGQQSDYDAIKAIYLEASDPSEKSRALGALPYAEDATQTQATLEFALSSQVRSQDTTRLIASVAYRGGDSLKAAWAFVERMYLQIAEKLGGEDEAADAMGKLIRNVASRFADEKAIGEVEDVFKKHSEYLTEKRLLEAAKENIISNMMWIRNNAQEVCTWLEQQE